MHYLYDTDCKPNCFRVANAKNWCCSLFQGSKGQKHTQQLTSTKYIYFQLIRAFSPTLMPCCVLEVWKEREKSVFSSSTVWQGQTQASLNYLEVGGNLNGNRGLRPYRKVCYRCRLWLDTKDQPIFFSLWPSTIISIEILMCMLSQCEQNLELSWSPFYS